MSPFAELVKSVWRGPAVQKVYCRIPDDHVLDPGYAGRAFEPDQAYFTISLSEMFLANARKLWQGFAPLTVAVAEFQYAGQRQSAPFVIGKDLLANIEPYLNGENVEYRNTRIFGPCPYTGGALALFVGLFQTAAKSPATEFFGVLGDIAGAFDLTGFSGYLPVAKVLTAGLGRLLGMTGTHLRVGARDEFTAGADGPSQLREGFLAYVNCSAEELRSPLWTKEGSLLSGATRDAARAVTDYDHCVVRLEWRAERNDYTSLPFHIFWNRTRDLIWQQQAEKARGSFLELVQQVAGSPDLTRPHRLSLLKAYRTNFEIELESYRATTDSVTESTGTRGTEDNSPAGPKATLQMDALASRQAGFHKDVETGLLGLAAAFPDLTRLRGGDPVLTDTVLSQQMRAIGSSTADPQQFADALVAAAFTGAARG